MLYHLEEGCHDLHLEPACQSCFSPAPSPLMEHRYRCMLRGTADVASEQIPLSCHQQPKFPTSHCNHRSSSDLCHGVWLHQSASQVAACVLLLVHNDRRSVNTLQHHYSS